MEIVKEMAQSRLGDSPKKSPSLTTLVSTNSNSPSLRNSTSSENQTPIHQNSSSRKRKLDDSICSTPVSFITSTPQPSKHQKTSSISLLSPTKSQTIVVNVEKESENSSSSQTNANNNEENQSNIKRTGSMFSPLFQRLFGVSKGNHKTLHQYQKILNEAHFSSFFPNKIFFTTNELMNNISPKKLFLFRYQLDNASSTTNSQNEDVVKQQQQSLHSDEPALENTSPSSSEEFETPRSVEIEHEGHQQQNQTPPKLVLRIPLNKSNSKQINNQSDDECAADLDGETSDDDIQDASKSSKQSSTSNSQQIQQQQQINSQQSSVDNNNNHGFYYDADESQQNEDSTTMLNSHEQQHQQQQQPTQETEEEDQSNSGSNSTAVFDPYIFIASLSKDKSNAIMPATIPLLPKKEAVFGNKPTLVLDLDETLVHCSVEQMEKYDFTFPVVFNECRYTVYVRCRPGWKQFLETVSKQFEVVLFTASQEVYAKALLDILDPAKQFIKYRLYRESCVIVDGNYLKDLELLHRDLAHTIIVDNSPQAFAYQVSFFVK